MSTPRFELALCEKALLRLVQWELEPWLVLFAVQLRAHSNSFELRNHKEKQPAPGISSTGNAFNSHIIRSAGLKEEKGLFRQFLSFSFEDCGQKKVTCRTSNSRRVIQNKSQLEISNLQEFAHILA